MEEKEFGLFCRLCFENDNLQTFKSVQKNMVKFIIPELDLNFTRNPQICNSCFEILQTCYDFKTTCLVKNEPEDSESKPDIESLNSDQVFPVKQELCYSKCVFCRKDKNNMVELPASDDIKIALEHIPELHVPWHSSTCEECSNAVERMSSFITTCLNTEENIERCYKKANICNTYEGRAEKMECDTVGNMLEVKSEMTDEGNIVMGNLFVGKVKLEPKLEDEEEISQEDDMKIEQPEFVDKREIISELLGKTSPDSQTSKKTEPEDLLYVKDGTTYRCSICPFNSSFLGIIKHVLIHKTAREQTQNEESDEQDEHEDEVPEYVKEENDYKCTTCPFKSNFMGIVKHVTTHKDPKKTKWFKCTICPFKTNYKRSLRRHVFIHEKASGIKTYNCETCSFQTKYQNVLEKHLLKHSDKAGEEVYKCEKCKYESKNKYHFKFHQLVHKDPSEVTMFKCEFCPFQTKRVKTIKCHVQRHNGPDILNCPECVFKTRQKKLFSNHLLLHKAPANVQVFKCDICGYLATKRHYIDRHMIIHKNPTELSTFECEICHKQIKMKKNLDLHMLKHKDPAELKVYQCEKCPFKSRFKEGFEKHVARHRKIMDYVCEDCGYTTRVKSHLTRHKVKHQDVEMFKCEVCPFKTKYKKSLKTHGLTHKKTLKTEKSDSDTE